MNNNNVQAVLDSLKYEVASELGITNYQNIDKGSLTSRENGSVGGNMVKRIIENYKASL